MADVGKFESARVPNTLWKHYISDVVRAPAPRRAGRWILLKLLRPREPSGDNIDVQFVGCRGWRSARAFGARDVC